MEYDDKYEIYVMSDEDGNDVTVQVLDYFFYNGDEYAVMTELAEGDQPWDENSDAEEGPEVFFMKAISLEDDNVEFEPIDDDLSDELFEVYSEAASEALSDEEE